MLRNTKIFDHVSPKVIEKILENFSAATGIGVSVVNPKGEPITKVAKASKLCDLAYENENSKKEITEIIEKNLSLSIDDGKIKIFNLYFDTYSFIVPIFLDGRVNSFFVSELARFGNPDITKCKVEADKLNIDLDTFLDFYLELPLMNEEKFDASASLLKSMASLITGLVLEKAMQNVKINDLENAKNDLASTLDTQLNGHKYLLSQFQTLFNNICDGAYIRSLDGTILDINRYGARLLGYEPKEVIGRNIKEGYTNQQDDPHVIKTLLEKGVITNYDSFVRCKDGSVSHISVNATAVKDPTGTIVGIQGLFHVVQQRVHNSINEKKVNDNKNSVITSNQHNEVTPQKA